MAGQGSVYSCSPVTGMLFEAVAVHLLSPSNLGQLFRLLLEPHDNCLSFPGLFCLCSMYSSGSPILNLTLQQHLTFPRFCRVILPSLFTREYPIVILESLLDVECPFVTRTEQYQPSVHAVVLLPESSVHYVCCMSPIVYTTFGLTLTL